MELQKAKQNFFKDRSVFYSTFPIQQQAERGDWNFKLAAFYAIGILDFVFDEDESQGRHEVVHRVQLKSQHHQVFYDKLTFIYLTLPNFTKTEDELDEIPPRLRERVFLSLFEKARLDEKRNLAIRMIRREMSDEYIVELTGLSMDVIAEIRANFAHFISDEPL
ncbi:PD-(D/E)XK nuclease family transposase [Methylotuvimicrobium sp. KM1]|uniref:PD-(D/E)XK nuclease family transposase n=1 Tax=Methylotuvimicrobium sp. KM1 TaxID=3377707 RepID=UPI003851572E